LSQVMLSLSRFAQDLMLFTMPEFKYFSLPPGFCTGSSIMPQKSNPDVLELIRSKSAKVLASASCVAEMVRGAPSGYNRDLQEAKGLLMEGFWTARFSLRVLARMVPDIKVNTQALLAGFSPDVFATDKALELVAGGMPFRDAYNHVKNHLEELKISDPYEAIAAKVHHGATAGLDFEGMATRVEEAVDFAEDERKAFARIKSRLFRTG